MTYQPPPGQGPIDPRGAFTPPPTPGNVPPRPPGMPPNFPPGMMPPPPNYQPGMMPPYPPPPMFMMPPQKQRGGFVRGIFLTLATTIFGLSLTLNIYLLVVSGIFGGGGGASQTNIIDGDMTQKVAVVPINGIIFDEMAAKFDRWLRAVENDTNVKAVVVEINSPGGSVTASDEIWHRMRQFKAIHPNKPLLISMGGLAASGGYYVACAGDEVYAQPTTLTGSIGVYLQMYNLSELADKWGIKDVTIESSGTPYKTAGSWLKPPNPEHQAYLQELADKSLAQFKDVIAKGRGTKLKNPLSEIANGKIFLADDAQAMGLVDGIKYPNEVYQRAAQKAGLTNMTVVRYRDPPTIFDTLTGSSGVAPPQGRAISVNGVNVNAGDVRELLTPRLMYLWRGQ